MNKLEQLSDREKDILAITENAAKVEGFLSGMVTAIILNGQGAGGACTEVLVLILPLAKGYAYTHQVGRNKSYVRQAQELLFTLRKERDENQLDG